jgi:carbon storage regulator
MMPKPSFMQDRSCKVLMVRNRLKRRMHQSVIDVAGRLNRSECATAMKLMGWRLNLSRKKSAATWRCESKAVQFKGLRLNSFDLTDAPGPIRHRLFVTVVGVSSRTRGAGLKRPIASRERRASRFRAEDQPHRLPKSATRTQRVFNRWVEEKDARMLVLSRKSNESIVINNNITVTVVEIRGDKVRLGIVAPKDIPVHRQEVFDIIHGQASQDSSRV